MIVDTKIILGFCDKFLWAKGYGAEQIEDLYRHMTDLKPFSRLELDILFENITKYAGGLDQGRILNIYRKISVFLGKENKKFQISKVQHGARSREYMGTIEIY